MVETKVPFGFHVESERYVDVREVPSGAKCGCKCPGCELPLIARHCMVGRVDHFAHNTRGQDKKVLEECTFSYWVSVAAMARQIFSDSETFDLAMPAYVFPPPNPWGYGYSGDHAYVCSKACTISLEQIEINRSLQGEQFDVTGEFQGVPIGIKLDHPERQGLRDFSDWDYNVHKAVVIAIDISAARTEFQHSEIPLRDVLARSMRTDLDCKRWLYHPRMAHHLASISHRAEESSPKKIPPQFQPQKQRDRRSTVLRAERHSLGSGPYQNEHGEYVFYCRRCDRHILSRARQCFCDQCSGVMYRLHRDQVNERILRSLRR